MAGALGKKNPKLCERVEENRGETLTFNRLPVVSANPGHHR